MIADARQQPKPVTGEPTAQPSDPNRQWSVARRVFVAYMTFATPVVVIGFVVVMCLSMRPRLPQFSVSSASISAFNLSSTHHLSGNWDLVFSVGNPNRHLSANYHTAHVSIFYGSSTILANTTLSPFSLGWRMETSISARLAAFSNYINDDTAAQGLEKDYVRGSIEFGVRLFSRVRFWQGPIPTRPYHIRVWCPHVPFGFSSPPQGDRWLRECEVHM